jgi:hypothetical protein
MLITLQFRRVRIALLQYAVATTYSDLSALLPLLIKTVANLRITEVFVIPRSEDDVSFFKVMQFFPIDDPYLIRLVKQW